MGTPTNGDGGTPDFAEIVSFYRTCFGRMCVRCGCSLALLDVGLTLGLKEAARTSAKHCPGSITS